jgi:glycosyltransferase involved in cell wall biosynthesis
VERFGFEKIAFKLLLKCLRPDYVWIHAEFWQAITSQFLWYYRFNQHPRLVAYVAVNHIEKRTPLVSITWPFLSRTRMRQLLLWPRLDGVSACATKAMECALRIGLPKHVPVAVNNLPVVGPDETSPEDVQRRWQKDDSFVVGFAGALTRQKGWKVLLAAVERLPERFRLVLAGDGEQLAELKSWLQRPGLRGRVCYLGLLPKAQLLAAYPLMDVLVLPSITTPNSVEQFGCVLAEAMACGVPVIGSDSGAIPETIGDAGLVVHEGEPDALADAIFRISENQALRQSASLRAMQKYRSSFSCEAYARSVAQLLGLENPRVE